MISIKVDNSKTGFIGIPGNTQRVVAHFKDGSKKSMELWDYLSMSKKEKNMVIQIDCFSNAE